MTFKNHLMHNFDGLFMSRYFTWKLVNKKDRSNWKFGTTVWRHTLYSGKPEEVEATGTSTKYLTNDKSVHPIGDKDAHEITLETNKQKDFFLKQIWKIGMMYTNDYFTIEKYFCRNYPGGYSDLLPNNPRLYLTSYGTAMVLDLPKKIRSKNNYFVYYI